MLSLLKLVSPSGSTPKVLASSAVAAPSSENPDDATLTVDIYNGHPAPSATVEMSPPAGLSRVSTSSTDSNSVESQPIACGGVLSNVAQTPLQPCSIPLPESPQPPISLAPPSPAHGPGLASMSSIHSQSSGQTSPQVQSQSQTEFPYSSQNPNAPGKDPRRFSLPSFAFLRSDTKLNAQAERKPTTHSLPVHQQHRVLSKAKDSSKKSKATRAFTIRALQNRASDKRAKESAAIVRALIIGDHNAPSDAKEKKVKSPSRSDIARVKTQLLQTKSASRVITHLRALPPQPSDIVSNTVVPIHAVCLDVSDQEADERYFARLGSVATASVDALSGALADMQLVDLLTAPNMGFGAPATAQGLFAGSVPTAETVLEGIEQITPQLLALGYATGKAILPDHAGVTVPNDRISVLTYWWGLELCLPPPTLAHLEAAASPSSALLNLLTALSVLSEGVREVLPFVRYLAQFVRTEWHAIKAVDEGRGVVCCATWIMPAALVPRAWDFADPPRCSEVQTVQPTATDPSGTRPSTTVAPQKPSTDGPLRSSSAYSVETGEEDEERPAISSEPPVLPELVVSSPTSMDGEPEVVDAAHEAHGQVQREGEAIVL